MLAIQRMLATGISVHLNVAAVVIHAKKPLYALYSFTMRMFRLSYF